MSFLQVGAYGITNEYGMFDCPEILRFPKGFREIKPESFTFSKKIKEIDIPYGYQDIGADACTANVNLSRLSLPNSLECIHSGAFSACPNLTTLFLPESLELIEDYAFASCHNLKTVFCESKNIKISSLAFSGTHIKNWIACKEDYALVHKYLNDTTIAPRVLITKQTQDIYVTKDPRDSNFQYIVLSGNKYMGHSDVHIISQDYIREDGEELFEYDFEIGELTKIKSKRVQSTITTLF
jgi:hypothetical protein